VAQPKADTVVVHYSEIALKLGHRELFENRLVANIRAALVELAVESVDAVYGRMLVRLGSADAGETVRRLSVVPGIANLLVCTSCEPTMEALEAVMGEIAGSWSHAGTFRVRVKRGDKRFPVESPEVARRLGAIVRRACGAAVDLGNADVTVYVEITHAGAFVSLEKITACGGLPVTTGGRVLLLLSGGIDSPVAGLRMLRRGCRLDAIHFHSVPYLNDASQDKARQLAAIIARGQMPVKLAMVAFGDVQSEIVRFVPRALRVVLYRRMMMRIACRVAVRLGIGALATGESLGQVASLRPLVGMDKLEISRYAQKWGTYETSIIPDQDCCTLFVPKHPATAAKPREVAAAETLIDVEGLVGRALEATSVEKVVGSWETAA
jgi:thiamine biosynthesis protein ThiI